ncbi:MFS transporter [Algicola sagamiensis]|uniref:MFS transporter n=1 Tax=Algicola sagamiensis TaxID=163869 RepID=UPI00037BD004|nr:MFS transporter [Algicola sagamiensis]
MKSFKFSKGMITFIPLLIATLVSMLGTMMTDFALGQWVFNETKSATSYGLIGFATLAPQLLLAPLIGMLIDRYPRALLMIIGHAGAGVCTLLLLFLFHNEILAVWMIVLLAGVASFFNGLMNQTLTVLTPAIVEEEHLVRVQGLIQGGFGIIEILVPAIAAFAVVTIGMQGVFLFDIVSFVAAIAIICVFLKRVNACDGRAKPSEEAHQPFLQNLTFGFRYIWQHQHLFQFLLFMSIIYFSVGIIYVLFTPLVLSFSDVVSLGKVLTAAGIGTLIGSAILALWKGPQSKLHSIYGSLFVIGFLMIGSTVIFQNIDYTIPLLSGIIMFLAAAYVITTSCDQVIWQTVIPKHIQGRVLGVQTVLSQSALPVAFLIAGPLADHVFEPMLSAQGALASTVGEFIGVGPGRGIVFFYAIVGVLIIFTILGFRPFLNSKKLQVGSMDEKPIESSEIQMTDPK